MTVTPAVDDELYRRGTATLLASWEEYARGSADAGLMRLDGVAAAVFPAEPERSVYNNALIDRGLGPGQRRSTMKAMQSAYSEAGVDRFAAWVHESEVPMQAELDTLGYRIEETTRVMGISLRDELPEAPDLDFKLPPWTAYLGYLEAVGVPAGLLKGADPAAFHVLAVTDAGELIATAIAFDHDGDCGIYNMSTLEPYRRRGIGTALVARHLHEAVRRGCTTASLQSTPIAEGVYASVGFRDLGRYFEYVPRQPRL